jgi:hypothetical protein
MDKDLREFIELVEKLGGAAPHRGRRPPLRDRRHHRDRGRAIRRTRLLFDAIKGFPRGFRIFTNATTSPLAWIGQFPPTSALSLAEARAIEEKVGSGAEVIPMTSIIGTSCPAMTVRIGRRTDLVTPPRWPN